MPRDFLRQLFTVRAERSQELFAEHDRHFEVDLVVVNAVFRLMDNDFITDAACEVERGQTGVYFLLRKSVGLAVEIDKTQRVLEVTETSVYKGYKQDKIEMRGDRAEMSDFPLYLNTVAGGLDRRDQTIGGFSFVVKIYAVPVVEIIG